MNQYRDKYKEVDYSNYLLKTSKVQRKNLTYELGLVYKGLHRDGLSDEEIKDVVKRVILHYNIDATPEFVNSTYDRVVEYNKCKELYQVDRILITDKEFEYIEAQPIALEFKKTLFALLCIVKIERELHAIKFDKNIDEVNFTSIIANSNQRIATIRKRLNIPANLRFIEDILHNLWRDGYVDCGMGENFIIRCGFIENIEESNNVICEVTNFQNLGLTYEHLAELGRFIYCKQCGVLVKASGNNSLYCKSCGKEMIMKKDRERKRMKN